MTLLRMLLLRGWIAALCALCGVAAPRAALAGLDQARELYKQGVRAYRAGKLQEALARFRESEEQDPTYTYPAFALGRIHHENFNQRTVGYTQAVDAYRRTALLIRIDPPAEKERGLYQVYYHLGVLYLKGGEYEKALEALRVFLELSPDFSNLEEVHNAIGIALYYLGQYDRAVEQFRAAIALDPRLAEARFNLRSVFTRLAIYNEAVALGRAGEIDLALEKADRLKEFAPRYLPGRRLEAALLQTAGRQEEALAVYNEMLGYRADSPATYPVRMEMAKILLGRGERAEARKLLEENLQRFPSIGDKRLQAEVASLLAEARKAP